MILNRGILHLTLNTNTPYVLFFEKTQRAEYTFIVVIRFKKSLL